MILEHFRLLVNLSATNVVHDEIITGTQEYFRILTQAVSRQIQVLHMKINFVVISLFFVLYNVTLSFLFCNCSITYMYYNKITTDKYRIYWINRPGCLLNFWTLRVGPYSRWALIRGWALKFSPLNSTSEVCLFCSKTINAIILNNKTQGSNKARFL